MATTPITIEVDAEAAKAYAAASPEMQRKIQLSLSLHLRQIIDLPVRPFREVADDISRRAAARGLTPEILESILDEGGDLQWQPRQ